MKDLYKVLGYAPDDSRLRLTRHTGTVYPITRFNSREEVERRREELQYNLRMSAGLYPWPDKTPLNTKRELVGEYEGYSVEKIMFESYPGFWSTGNLYLPRPLPEKSPAIFNVIGHWGPQRLERSSGADYPQQLANFARMGFICLVTDMIGMVDSRQISHEYGKGEKELWLSNGLGVQLWNNIRALDLLCSMPEVDRNNIGMTGASGGGSQTLFLSLIDDRIKAAAPINMISLHMQGGCQCENAAGLRRHTDNTEMCAMIAPRPLFLAGSDGDWTKNLESTELPAVLEAYRQYGAESMVEHFYQIAPHQYNEKTRHKVYSFFARHLMGKELDWEEQPIEVADLNAFTWFRGEGMAPGFKNDDEYFAAYKAELGERIESLQADEKKKMLKWMTGICENKHRVVLVSSEKNEGISIDKYVAVGENGERIPFVKLCSSKKNSGRVCLALSGSGKNCLDEPAVSKMVSEGISVICGDLFLTGESAECKQEYIGGPFFNENYYTTFHYSVDACRVQDAYALIKVASDFGGELSVWAEGCGARSVACALPFCGEVKTAMLEKSALELEGDEAYFKSFFIPGIRAIGGIEACVSLADCEITTF
ncbi:MAG: acetylxylan esterase [Clostridia bacterium]|nr:acetylxylan esterase [Clostridia bacterium]